MRSSNRILRTCLGLALFAIGLNASAQAPSTSDLAGGRILTVEGVVQIFPVKGAGWVAAQTNQPIQIGDRIRTGPRSRATARLTDLTVLRINEMTTLQIQPPSQPGKVSTLDVKSGSTYYQGRGKPAEQEFQSPLTSGAIRGTEFDLTVGPDGRTVVSLIDGEVTLSNAQGRLDMGSGEQGIVEPGQRPTKTALIEANNIIQWCLYYPGVLNPDELDLAPGEVEALRDSLSAYRAGDLLQALALYPENQPEGSDSQRVYRAAVLLAAGQVGQAEEALSKFARGGVGEESAGNKPARLANALRELVATVKQQQRESRDAGELGSGGLSTEWLARSYSLQSRYDLKGALRAARKAAELAPDFGFAWARVAELELGFGRMDSAANALDTSLRVAPRNAQTHALQGFMLLARGGGGWPSRLQEARAAFERAMEIDGALGNAWLGRGLCRIEQGEAESGRQDIQVAAVLEPQRAILRSYLGKAFGNAGDSVRARKELVLAQGLDPNDPTAWLYSALIAQRENDINQAVRDLEQSKDLNDNRRLFRSRLLLDQDQAVRSANLANIYQDTGILSWNKGAAMSEWSVREASRAVNYDYGNFSAHQFLANSYDAVRDPRQINLRYETAWLSELLVAHLLAPAGAANLSEFSSQQQYARLFPQNHFGFSSQTEYLSHGDWLERASQYGAYGPMAYALDVEYRSENGWRANNDLEQFTGAARIKTQLSPKDSVFFEALYYNSTFGDVAQYYNHYGNLPGVTPAPSLTFRARERQEPNLFFGYHREWAPGSHTLFLGGRLDDRLQYSDTQAVIPFTRVVGGQVVSATGLPFVVDYERDFSAWTAELQQIWQTELQTLVAGGRYQTGTADTFSQVDRANTVPSLISRQDIEADLARYSVYAYETIKPVPELQLTLGLSYDRLDYPVNIDTSPITSKEDTIDQFSPKAGLIWSLPTGTHLRAGFTRSLGGVFYDTSVRLEPTQVAGFNQAFRSIIPESVVGLVPGTRFTTYGVGVDQSFKTGTYVSLDLQLLESEAERTVGVVTNSIFLPVPNAPGSTRQDLDFAERSLLLAVNQLIDQNWSVGCRYQLSRAELEGRFTQMSEAAAGSLNQDQEALLHQLVLYGNYYHRCGFFAQVQGLWFRQDNEGYSPGVTDSDFWQVNAFAGYRFLKRAAEARIGLLNLTDQDYRLNPLNLYYDLPRSRTLSVSLKLYF